ncbi:RING/U-box superfamily protein [Striga asiatica]|uniref:RING-type E3 ubiquitin transferase n=1 Tax=Striga asiatica TaxID=4170 RepID=A0A5A7QFB1_STRAF|nr:RING/U-box superfamily protein [Striga asiatica]
MDADSENDFREFPEFPRRHIHTIDTCTFCHRAFLPDNIDSDLDFIGACGDCKFALLENLDAATSHSPDAHRRHPQARLRTRHGSSDSIESMFSQQFSQLVNLARQNQSNSVGPTSSRTTPSGSRRWRRRTRRRAIIVSDTESESNSNVSLLRRYSSSYSPWDSNDDDDDDGWSSIENENENENDISYSDNTDIDPMNAGLYQWSSEYDDDDDDDPILASNLLERLAEAEGLRRGPPPPASVSFVESIPRVAVEEEDGEVCAICKDSFVGGSFASRLPCGHVFHSPCILPWLSARSTCPLCRRELPTDDRDYEAGKRDGGEVVGPHGVGYGGDVDGASGYVEVGTRDNRWFFLVAPIVGIIGVSLMLCLGGKPLGGHRFSRPRENGQRRWWSFF